MSCGVSACRHRAKQFGVCGVHKRWFYLCDDPQFQADMNVYRQLTLKFAQEEVKLKAQGIDLLGIQNYWDNNLCGPRQHPLPEYYRKAGEIMESFVPFIKTMQQKYDPNLVYNACVRISHETTNCECSYCKLGM